MNIKEMGCKVLDWVYRTHDGGHIVGCSVEDKEIPISVNCEKFLDQPWNYSLLKTDIELHLHITFLPRSEHAPSLLEKPIV
jgi:hypothetical protein